MHAVIITFDRTIPDEAYTEMCHHFADGFSAIEGLVAKAFVGQGRRSGGVYFFTSAATADAYLAGPIVSGLRAAPGIARVDVQRFEVDAAVSARTGLAPLLGVGVPR